MENLDQDFKKLAKRTKRRRRLVTVGLSALMTVVVVVVGAVIGRNVYVGQAYNRAVVKVNVYNEIMSPNLDVLPVPSGVNGLLGGAINTTSSKNIDGYPVAWGQGSLLYGVNSSTRQDVAQVLGGLLFKGSKPWEILTAPLKVSTEMLPIKMLIFTAKKKALTVEHLRKRLNFLP